MNKPVDEELARKKAAVKDTKCCPYCDTGLHEVDTTMQPMAAWGAGLLYICYNDDCSYYQGSFNTLAHQGAGGGAYRLVYDPERDWCGPVAARRAVPPKQ